MQVKDAALICLEFECSVLQVATVFSTGRIDRAAYKRYRNAISLLLANLTGRDPRPEETDMVDCVRLFQCTGQSKS